VDGVQKVADDSVVTPKPAPAPVAAN
jgi:hypothetical protein